MTYDGPAGFVVTREEAEHLSVLLLLYPRSENAELRARLYRYLNNSWEQDADARAPRV